MNLVLKKSYIFFLFLFFYFVADFAFPVGGFSIPFYFLAALFFIIFCLLKYPKLIFNKIELFYKTRIGKFFVFFLIWVVLSIFSSLFIGTFIPRSFFSNFIGNFFCSNLFPFLIPIIAIPFFISYKKLGKYLLVLYFIMFFAGVLEYIANSLGITFIQQVFSLLVNRISTVTGVERVFVQAYGNYRISGLCQEPGTLAAFIFISSPIIWFLCTTKTKFFKNFCFDFLFKKMTILLMIVCFIGTQSPINLAFMSIFLGAILFYKLITFRIQYKALIFTSVFVFLFLTLSLFVNLLSIRGIDVSETYLSRIMTVIESVKSITELTLREPSLATRVGNYYAQLKIGLSYPIFGVGYGNVNSIWAETVKNLQIPITNELAMYAYGDGKQAGGSSMLFKLFAEAGFVGAFLFLIFIVVMFFDSNKKNIIQDAYEKNFLLALRLSLILYSLTIYYMYLNPLYWIYWGILVSINLSKKMGKINVKGI